MFLETYSWLGGCAVCRANGRARAKTTTLLNIPFFLICFIFILVSKSGGKKRVVSDSSIKMIIQAQQSDDAEENVKKVVSLLVVYLKTAPAK